MAKLIEVTNEHGAMIYINPSLIAAILEAKHSEEGKKVWCVQMHGALCYVGAAGLQTILDASK